KLVDKTCALIGRLIGDESPGFVGSGEETEKIEICPAHKLVIRTRLGRINPERPELREDLLVNVIRRPRVRPHKRWPCRQERQPDRLLNAQKSNHNRRLPHSISSDQPRR